MIVEILLCVKQLGHNVKVETYKYVLKNYECALCFNFITILIVHTQPASRFNQE